MSCIMSIKGMLEGILLAVQYSYLLGRVLEYT